MVNRSSSGETCKPIFPRDPANPFRWRSSATTRHPDVAPEREVRVRIGVQEDDNGQTVGRVGIGSPTYSNSEIGERLYTVRRYGPVEGIGVAAAETWQRTALSARFLWRMVTGGRFTAQCFRSYHDCRLCR